MLVFLLQKRLKLQFDEADEEGMTDLLVAAATHLSTTAEQSPVAKEAQVEPSERVDSGAWGASPFTEAPGEVADVPFERMDRELKMPAKPLIPLSYFSMRILRPRCPYSR